MLSVLKPLLNSSARTRSRARTITVAALSTLLSSLYFFFFPDHFICFVSFHTRRIHVFFSLLYISTTRYFLPSISFFLRLFLQCVCRFSLLLKEKKNTDTHTYAIRSTLASYIFTFKPFEPHTVIVWVSKMRTIFRTN